MLKLIRIVLLCLFILSLPKANAVTTNEIPNYVPINIETNSRSTELGQKLTVGSVEMYKTILTSSSDKYGVEIEILTSVISCESQFNRYALGDNGHSRGLVQIHNVWHSEVTDTQAYDPEFAINFLAKAISEGRGNEWTCYRKLSTTKN